jgi:hypothetical protein
MPSASSVHVRQLLVGSAIAAMLVVVDNPLALTVAAFLVLGQLLLDIRHHRGRPRVARGSVVPFPAGRWPWSANGGILAVGSTEVVTWATSGGGRTHAGVPVAVVARGRIYDATFEVGHRLTGGGWIHLVDIDGERAVLGVRDTDAGRGVVAALSRDRSVAAG